MTVLNEHKLTRMSVFQQNDVVFIFHNFSRIIVLKKTYCSFSMDYYLGGGSEGAAFRVPFSYNHSYKGVPFYLSFQLETSNLTKNELIHRQFIFFKI